jgi:tetratricopeptide (TPR) repeat protein
LVSGLFFATATAPARQRAPIPEEVTYTGNIASILRDRCVQCHRPNGGAPFSLLTYEDARRRAAQIVDVTTRRYMPPWKPVPGHGGPFIEERRLTDEQIAAIARWVDLGSPEGRAAELPAPQISPDGWRLGVPDLVVEMPRPYTLPADMSDVFRNFAVPIPVPATRCVRGIEFRPGTSAVHHTNMLVDRTRSSRRFDDQDPEPGYDGPIAPDAEYPDGHFLGWTPGQVPPLLPEDMCWRLEAGSDLLLQMHLRPTGKPEVVQSAVALFFSERPATRIPVMLRLSRQDIVIPAGERSHRVRDTYVVPVDIEVQAVQPHAHYLAREVRGFAELPDGSTRWLVHIADWDFNWQDTYRYAEPFWLPGGTRLVMEYTYDNSAGNVRNPHQPPRRVSWGQQTTDEMGDLWIQVLTRTDDDRLRLTRNVRDKALRDDITGHQTMLRTQPGDAALHESLAKSYLQVGQIDQALSHVEEAVRLKPDSPSARYNLGTALAAQNRHEAAILQFTEAVRLDPNLAYAHNSLGVSLHALGRTDQAIARFRRAIEIEPAYANAHNNLGKTLEVQGDLDEALVHYREAIRILPDSPQAQQNLGGALLLAGETAEAVVHYRRALELRPDLASVAGRLAWILSTHPAPEIREPQEAIQWAERAASSTGRRDAAVLDILGAAYASAGRFDAATAAAQSALDLAIAARADELAREIRTRLDLYRRGQPYRESLPPARENRF